MEVLMRFFILLFMVLVTLKAEDIVLLNTHIRMIPKIMALDTRFSSIATNKSVLAIVYDGNRKNNAVNIANEINLHYAGKVANVTFNAIALSSEELIQRRDITFVYLTKMSTNSVKKVADWGIINNVPTFSYDVADIEDGILGSIVIERSTVIYINRTVFKAGNFRFNDNLFQIARLIN